MELSKQVCSLEQALKLKELGISQHSYFSWCGDRQLRLMDNGKDGVSYSDNVHVDLTKSYNNMELDHREDVPTDKPFAAAFTAAELIQMNGDNGGIHLSSHGEHKNKFYMQTDGFGEGKKPVFTFYNSFAEASAAKLINALEKKWLDISDCNQRLIA